MQKADRRTFGEIIIDLHQIAREMERKAPLSAKVEAFEIRKIADRIAHIQKSENEL